MGYTLEQLGDSVKFILGLSGAALGFALQLLQSNASNPIGAVKLMFALSIITKVAAVSFGIWSAINRLESFLINKNIK